MIHRLSAPGFEAGSFRDRSGRVFTEGAGIYRAIDAQSVDEWGAVSQAGFLTNGMRAGEIVHTERSPHMDSFAAQHGFVAALEHEKLPLISWPYEWSFSMLREAALLTLNLMQRALADGDGYILKDASAFNVQFRGSQPVFIDTGSFTRFRPGQIWDGYRQFCQMFLYPLMLNAWKGIHFQPWLRGSLAGIAPDQFVRMLSMRDLFRRGAMTHGWLHARLQQRTAPQTSVASSMQTSGFSKQMIQNNVAGLQKVVSRLQWTPLSSTWSDYDAASEPVQRDGSAKEKFIAEVCAARHSDVVWDLGCNQGRYSRIAAGNADVVVAMDSDHLTVDRFFQALRRENNSRITPLVSDLTDPSPSLGWRASERRSLKDRSKPDLVLCLALIHHLVIAGNLPLSEVIDWLASLNAAIVVEFVDRGDAQVTQLLANRADVFHDYTRETFLNLIGQRFEIRRTFTLPSGHRTLFLLHPLCHQGVDPVGR